MYTNIGINIENINIEFVNLEDDDENTDEDGTSEDTTSNVQDAEEGNDDNEEIDDPLNKHRQAASETCLQSVLPDYPITTEMNTQCSLGNEVYNIAAGENKHPVSIMRDDKCEETAFPVLFPNSRLGYTYERDTKLSPVTLDFYIILEGFLQILNNFFLPSLF